MMTMGMIIHWISWYGRVQYGLVWYGVARFVGNGLSWEWCCVVYLGAVWFGMVWFGRVPSAWNRRYVKTPFISARRALHPWWVAPLLSITHRNHWFSSFSQRHNIFCTFLWPLSVCVHTIQYTGGGGGLSERWENICESKYLAKQHICLDRGGKYFAKVKQRRSCLDQNTGREISRCGTFRESVESAYLAISTRTHKPSQTPQLGWGPG